MTSAGRLRSLSIAIAKGLGGFAIRRPLSTGVAALLIGVAIAHVGDVVTYSDGLEAGRRGTIIKFSHKGFFPCTSWEGQLAMEGFRSANNGSSNIFEFSVRDAGVRDAIIDAYKSGSAVQLGYTQTYSHWSCLRATDYWIEKVIVAGPAAKS